VIHVVAGDALDIPPGFGFQVKVTGHERLRLLCSNAPPWPGPEEAIPIEGGLGSPRG
jgi:mannose-6-phosphate isomerase-like protein (cupin superfamily)